MRPLVYICGPYTHPDPVVNTRNAVEAGMRVWDEGLGVPLIPHLSMLTHLIDPRPVETWYQLDLRLLDHCGALWRLPGESAGADREVAYARARCIRVLTTWEGLCELLGSAA